MPSVSERRRVLLAVLVYNGRAFVPACIESAARTQQGGEHDVDVLVLDDCSPEPGFSEDIAELCERLGVQYYRSPRNLGIPRNMNMGLLRALDSGYDHVILCNSDVIVPATLADTLVRAGEADPSIGSVTAWSNNVSVFSLPNADPTANLGHQGAVDFLSDALAGEFGGESLTIPTAVGFCMLIPTTAVRQVGLLDPVFGRGYCEEVDWCQRAKRAGLKNVLAAGSFVYHVGNATTREAGLLERNQFTSWANEAIIDLRYPTYRDDLDAFDQSGRLEPLMRRALQALIVAAAREWGYSIEASWLHRQNRERVVQFVVEPDGQRPLLTGRFQGFEIGVPLDTTDVVGTVQALVGRPPVEVSVFDRGELAAALERDAGRLGLTFVEGRAYPERV
jgi:GT2 family glycosyltransferase